MEGSDNVPVYLGIDFNHVPDIERLTLMEISVTVWWVYTLASTTRKTTYTGATTDVQRRLRQHNGELKGGAKATRMGRPWVLLETLGPFPNQSEAQRAEYQVKASKR